MGKATFLKTFLGLRLIEYNGTQVAKPSGNQWEGRGGRDMGRKCLWYDANASSDSWRYLTLLWGFPRSDIITQSVFKDFSPAATWSGDWEWEVRAGVGAWQS